MEDLLYLDTARIGQISPSAALACSAVTKLANDDPRQIFDEVVKVLATLRIRAYLAGKVNPNLGDQC